MSKTDKQEPNFSFEERHNGIVCGLDEVGRAPLAGPVTAACVYIPPEVREHEFLIHVKDSKKLSKTKREVLYDQIIEHCLYGIADIWQQEIDRINIHHASLLAMQTAYDAMRSDFDVQPKHALVDGKFSPQLSCESTTIIKGDSVSRSIAAASIIAKVHRDRYMQTLHEEYPYYGWNTNAGYPTKQHLEALQEHGITDHHRRSFSPIKDYALAV